MRYTLADLQTLMARLRDPEDGCPWDLKQDFRSIVPHTLEEVYELVDAIEQGDSDQVCQEMGDVLFQLIFYSQLAAEEDAFTFDDVVHGIAEKLLRRHPHVFPKGTLDSRRSDAPPEDGEIKARWEEIKSAERGSKAQHSLMDDIPAALPAASRAGKLQKRACQIGFDWENVDQVFVALNEELDELKQALADGQRDAIADELGDVLFSAVNLCRHIGFDAETLLRAAGQKFERRFRFVEQCALEVSKQPEKVPSEQLELFWTEAKAQGL